MSVGEFTENLRQLTGQGRPAEKSAVAKENEQLLGLASGSIEGVMDKGPVSARKLEEQGEKRKVPKKPDTALYLQLLDMQIAMLESRIDSREQNFEQRYGADWREHMAQRILDPDDYPHREECESIDAYHLRIEEAMIDKMTDDNGDIRSEYLADPEYRQWAEWARDEAQLRKASEDMLYIKAGGLSPQEVEIRVQEVISKKSLEQLEELQRINGISNVDDLVVSQEQSQLDVLGNEGDSGDLANTFILGH